MAIEYAFAAIPHSILYDKRLSLGAKVIYALLKSRAMDKDYCLVGRERLAKDANMGLRSVKVYVSELKRFKLIKTKQRRNNSSVTFFTPICSLYTTSCEPFGSIPQDEQEASAEYCTPECRILHPGSAGSCTLEVQNTAPKEEEGEEEEDPCKLFLDLMENDPVIDQAVTNQTAQIKKRKVAAEKRINSPTVPTRQPAVDNIQRYLSEVPGNLSDTKAWTGYRIYRAFKSVAESQGLELSHMDSGNVSITKTIMGQLDGRGYSRDQSWKFLFHYLIPNWAEISRKVFRNVNASDPRTIALGLVSTRLSDIINSKGSVDVKTDKSALARLKAKITPGVVT